MYGGLRRLGSEFEGYESSPQLEYINETWAQLEHSRLANVLSVEESPLTVTLAKEANKALNILDDDDLLTTDLYAKFPLDDISSTSHDNGRILDGRGMTPLFLDEPLS